MLKFKQSLATFVGLFALLGLFTLATPQQSFGQSGAKVQPAPTPVPVTVTNPTLSVTGTVDITGTPTVSLAPGASVRDADNPALQPFQATLRILFAPGQSDASGIIAVPAGKRFVIEHVSGFGNIPETQEVVNVFVQTKQGFTSSMFGSTVFHYFIPTNTGRYGGAAFDVENFVISAQTRLYADGGIYNGISVHANRNSTVENGNFHFSLSGYLVDVPTP